MYSACSWQGEPVAIDTPAMPRGYQAAAEIFYHLPATIPRRIRTVV